VQSEKKYSFSQWATRQNNRGSQIGKI
jgi:hypothetical protein